MMGASRSKTEATDTPSTAVVEAVAAEEGWEEFTASTEPLYETIDPDALDALVESTVDGTISFTYSGYEIMVDADGRVTLAECRSR